MTEGGRLELMQHTHKQIKVYSAGKDLKCAQSQEKGKKKSINVAGAARRPEPIKYN